MSKKHGSKRELTVGGSTNPLKICIVLVALLFFVGQANAETWCEDPNEDNVTVCKSMDPNIVRPDGAAKMRLNVSWPVELIEFPIPADVVLAIDSSGSMEKNDPDRIRVEASKIFVDKMEGGNGERYLIGLVSWDHRIDFSEPLSNNFTLIKERIDKVDQYGYTDLNVALRESIKLLDNSTRNTDTNVTRAIILLTDGKHLIEAGPFDPSIVEEAKNKGHKIYTIGMGTDIDKELLERIATETRGEHRHAKEPEDLIPIYEEFAGKVLTKKIIKITNITITDVLHNYLRVNDNTFSVNPTTGPLRNLDGTATMVWEVKKEEEEKGFWETSVDVFFDFSSLPVDVTQTYRDRTHRSDAISVVTYTVEGKPQSIPIPSGNMSIKCHEDTTKLSVSTTTSSPPPFVEGQEVAITATIENIGDKEVRDIEVGFSANGEPIGKRYIDALKPGEEAEREINWIAEEGANITTELKYPVTSPSSDLKVPLAIAGVIAAILAIVYLMLRRRRRA